VRVIEAEGDEIIAVKRSNLTPEQKTRLALFDNRSAELAEWDAGVLEGLSEEIDLSGLWNDEELSALLNEDVAIELDEEEPSALGSFKPAITARGDVYGLGEHRLICADCTDTDAVEILMNNEKANMVFTDPPYDLDSVDFGKTLLLFSENAHVFVMHDDRGIVSYLRESSLHFKQFFVATTSFSMPRGNDPYLRHILVSHETNGDAISHQNLHDGLSSVIVMKYRGTLDDDETQHKHQKSIEFIGKFIEHYSKRGDIILDVFGGSGSTLIACEQLQRKAYLVELDEHHCDAIVRRYIAHCEKANKEAIVTRNGAKVSSSEYQA
jgi:16S rRNA G966 N2-methylase RsmD